MPEGPSSILLYPNIELKDPVLVKEALLLYDNLYRIVPSGYKPNDHPELLRDNVDFEIVGTIYPEKYTEKTYEKFQTKLKKWSPIAAGFSAVKIARSDKLHEGKVYGELRKYFADEGLLIKDGRWLRGNNALIANYMIYLSNEIAGENSLGLLTTTSSAWTTQEFINYDGNYGQSLHENLDRPIWAGRSLVGMYLTDFIPRNLSKIPFSEIMAFRDEYKHERQNFLRDQSLFVEELSKIKAPIVFEDRIKSLQDRLRVSLGNYRDSCSKLGPKHFFGAKIVTIPLVTPAAYALTHDPLLTALFSSIGISFGGIWSLYCYLDERYELQKTNPYSYLDLLEKYSFQTIKEVNSELSSDTMEFMLD